MRRDYGDWITDYTDPKPHRYHAGLKAGQSSQAGIITTMLLRSTVEKGRYDEDDFCRRLDEELFPKLDGKPMSGPGRYTSQSIREAWRRRVEQKKSWKETGGHADTTEAAERGLVLGADSRSINQSAQEIAAAMSSRMTSRSPNWARNFLHPDKGFSAVNSLRPSRSRRARASASLKPRRASVPSAAISASADS
jgi:hypothetical protein